MRESVVDGFKGRCQGELVGGVRGQDVRENMEQKFEGGTWGRDLRGKTREGVEEGSGRTGRE